MLIYRSSFSKASLDYNPLQMSRSPPSSLSTFIVPPFHHRDVDKRMSGKGFIEPHRNNLPRRKRKIRVVTNAEDGAAAIALEIDKTVSQILLSSEAGPLSSTTESNLHDSTSPTSTDSATFAFTTTMLCPPAIKTHIHASSSVDTNITNHPSSFGASPIHSAPSPGFSNSSTIYLSNPTLKTPKRSRFSGYYLDNALPRYLPPITPSKGHLQPTSDTLPRRHRLSVAREERRRRSIAEQQRQSICAQELTKGITLGFLAEENEHDEKVVRIIKVYDDSIISFASSSSPATISPSTLSSESYLQLTLPTNSSSYIDGTTSLTDSQIQQACTFIDEHISIPLVDTSSINSSTLRPGHVSVLILTPCIRPEEAMSIGISYLAGIEDGVQETKGDKAK